MKMFMVGNPESFYNVRLFCCTSPRVIDIHTIKRNLKTLQEIRLFGYLEDAINYARTQRICEASFFPNSRKKKIAPVVHVELSDALVIKLFERNPDSEMIHFPTFEKPDANFPAQDEQGRVKTLKAKIEYMVLPPELFNFKDVVPVGFEFPDSDLPLHSWQEKSSYFSIC